MLLFVAQGRLHIVPAPPNFCSLPGTARLVHTAKARLELWFCNQVHLYIPSMWVHANRTFYLENCKRTASYIPSLPMVFQLCIFYLIFFLWAQIFHSCYPEDRYRYFSSKSKIKSVSVCCTDILLSLTLFYQNSLYLICLFYFLLNS